jgi:transposase
MHSNCTKNLLNLEDVFIKKVVHAEHYVKIFIETKPSIQTCPDCGTQTKRIHDYRFQEIKDIPFQMKYTYLVLKKRRYVCKCGKRFTEKYHFLPSYQRRTLRLSFKIIDQLRNLVSIKSVAETTNVSVSTVTRLLDTVRSMSST